NSCEMPVDPGIAAAFAFVTAADLSRSSIPMMLRLGRGIPVFGVYRRGMVDGGEGLRGYVPAGPQAITADPAHDASFTW
ncbi:MAG: hypothetical protein LC808_00440, partial [Actinobacteria bacterium]|nr:hypothetical protein [Actinomycetota bacterium]